MVAQIMCGIDLIYGHILEELVEELADQLRGRIGDVDALFEPATILVPNLAMQTYLEQELAWRLGVTPNVEFRLLRGFLADHLPQEVTIQGVTRPIALLEREQLYHILVELFGDLDGDRLAGCEEVRAYLKRDDNPVAGQRRRYQLAKKLSQVFIEYSFSRSRPLQGAQADEATLLERWRQLGARGAKELGGTERWQQVLWWQIFGEGGLVEEIEARTEVHLLTLADALALIEPDQLRLPDSFYMVGFPYISRLFVEAIALFAERSKVSVYTLIPTKSWHDSLLSSIEEEEQLLLQQWGSAGFEQYLMWKDRARSVRFIDSEVGADGEGVPATILEAVQQDLISPGSSEPVKVAKTDKSLQFLECPSIKREVEIVANEIWALLLEDQDQDRSERLRPDDIAVLIAGADQQEYQAQIEAVFKGFDGLPYTMVSLPGSAANSMMEAAKLLLSLPFGRFTRQELLRLLVHPNIGGRTDREEADDWQRWCEQLHILHGADKEELAHTYLGEPVQLEEGGPQYHWDLYSWEQGFQRAALGSFLSGEPSGVDSRVKAGAHHYEPLELPGTSTGSVARFATLGSSLIRDARWLVGEGFRDHEYHERSAEEWAQILVRYLETYLKVRPGLEISVTEQAMTLGIVRQIVSKVGLDCPVEGPVPYRVFYESVRDELESVQTISDASLTRGVIVSTALSLRAIPFEHIFVVGLGGEQFPNPDVRDPLDLRDREEPQLGDLKPTDRDRYIFLETFLAARKSLTLSWVSREATTGEHLEPSSVISQLRWYLKERLGSSERPKEKSKEELLTQKHPLSRFDEAYFSKGSSLTPGLHGEAWEEFALQAIRDAFVEQEGALKIPSLQELREQLFEPEVSAKDCEARRDAWEALKKKLAIIELPHEVAEEEASKEPIGAEDPVRPVYISLSRLRKFLESPLQGAAQIQLGLKEEEEDLFSKTREDLACDRLNNAIVLRAVAHQALIEGRGADEIAELYDGEFLEDGVHQGRLPAGHFLKYQRDEHLKTLAQWWENFEKLQLHEVQRWAQIGIGRDGSDGESSFEALEFDLNPGESEGVSEPLKVIITGVTEPTSQDGDVYMSFVHKPINAGSKRPEREQYFLRPFLSWIAATAAGHVSSGAVRLVLNTTHKKSYTPTGKVRKDNSWAFFTREHRALSQEEAQKYLKDLVVEALTKTHDYLLPVETVAEIDPELVIDDQSEVLLELLGGSSKAEGSDRYGPIKDLERFGGPKSPDLAETLKARYPHLFGGLK